MSPLRVHECHVIPEFSKRNRQPSHTSLFQIVNCCLTENICLQTRFEWRIGVFLLIYRGV